MPRTNEKFSQETMNLGVAASRQSAADLRNHFRQRSAKSYLISVD